MSDIKLGITISADGKRAVAEINSVSASAQSATGKINTGFQSSQRSTESFNRALSESKLLMAGMGAAAAYAMKQMVDSTVRAASEIDRMKGMLEAASGSSQKAAANFKFIQDTAWQMGTNLNAAAEGFTQLTAAAQGTALQGQATRDIFTSIVKASSALGKSSYDTQGMLSAIGQMMSKGTVQAEELRGQLGERLPGAFNLAAQAMGVTTAQLNDMLQKGQVTAEEMLPRFAKVLDDTYSNARFKRINNEIERLDQTWENFKRSVIDTEGMASAIRGLTDILKAFSDDVQASFGLGDNGLQASLEKRITEQKRVIAEMKKAGPLGRLFIDDAEIQQRETELRQMQDRLDKIKKSAEQATRDATQAATAGAPGGRASTPLGIAQSFQGMNERGNAEELTKFLNEHSGTVFNNLTVPWCARFVNAALDKAGIKGTGSAGARSFETFGKGIWQRGMSQDALADVQPGDIAVFTRKGGGHVGFVKAIDPTKGLLEILGGNQSNSVSVAKRSMQDLLAIRRPPTPGAKGEYEDFDKYTKRAKQEQETAQREAEKRQRDATQRYINNLDDQAKAAQRQSELAISGIDNQIAALDRERDAWDKAQQDKIDAAKGSYDAMARLEAERSATLQDYAGRELALIQRQFDARRQAMDAAASAFRKQLTNPNLTDDEERRAKQSLADVQADLIKLANDRAQAESKAGQAAIEANRGGLELAQKQREFIANINAELEFQKQLYLQLKAAKEAGATPEGLAVIRAGYEAGRNVAQSVSQEEIALIQKKIDQNEIVTQQINEITQTEQDRAGSVREQQLRENAYWDQLMGRAESLANLWTQIYDVQESGMSRLTVAMARYSKDLAQIKTYWKDPKIMEQWGNMSGLMKGLQQAQAGAVALSETMLAIRSTTEKGTKAYEDLTTAAGNFAIMGQWLNVVEGIGAVIHQLRDGDVYTAIPRALGVAAMVASMGVQTGVIGGAGTQNATMKYSDGTNKGVFGDSTAASESITKSLEIIRDNSSNDLNYSAAMLRALEGIEAAMGGVTNTIIRGVQPAAFKAGVVMTHGDIVDPGGLSKMDPILSFMNKLMFNITRRVSDFGLAATSQALSAILKQGFSGSVYTDIETSTKVLGMTVAKSVKTVFQDMDPAIAKQFTLAFKSISTAIVEGGKAFGLTAEDFVQRMRGFMIDIEKVSTKDMTGEELQKKITQMFSEQSDRMARRFMPGLGKFQQVGEGYFQTFIRVAEAVNRAGGELDRLGVKAINYRNIERKQADIAAEIVRESLLQQNGLAKGVRQYVAELSGSAEDIIDAYKKLKEASSLMQTAGAKGGDANLNRTMINAAGGLDAFVSSMQDFKDTFLTDAERLAGDARDMAGEFAKLGLRMPTTNDEFKKLVQGLDTSTEAGQKLFGKLVSLSGGFAKLTAAVQTSMDALKSAYDTAKAQSKSLHDYLAGLRTGDSAAGSPMDRYRAAKARFDDLKIRAQLGDQSAIDALQGAASDYLSLSKQIFAGTEQYSQDLNAVEVGLGKLAGLIDDQISAAEKQVPALLDNTSALTSLNTALARYTSAVDALKKATDDAAKAYTDGTSTLIKGIDTLDRIGGGTGGTKPIGPAGKPPPDAPPGPAGPPPYAMGGLAAPGWAIVGEQGPELVNFTSPARVYTATQTREALSQKDDGKTFAALEAIKDEMRALVRTQSGANPAIIGELQALRARLDQLERNQRIKA